MARIPRPHAETVISSRKYPRSGPVGREQASLCIRISTPRKRIRPGSTTSEMHSGRHFLQIPGPTNVPDRVLRAIAAPVIDHRGPEFAGLFRDIMPGLRRVFGTEEPVVIFPSSGTGAWEAALVSTLSPGDTVLIAETGHFAALWAQLAGRLGLRPEVMPG